MAADSSDRQDSPTGAKADAGSEFFSVGPALHAVRAGYIRRRADEQLFETLVAGRYAHVLAPERSGKSSLIAATAARLESQGFKIATLDLAQLSDRDGGSDPGRWYYSVAYRLLRQLRVRYDLQTWWQDKSFLSSRQRLFEFYSEIILQFVSERVVIFVDEIQCIEDLSYADQFLTSIRAAHNARTTDPDFSRLSFVLLGECDPLNLQSEAELSPFNITQQILLEDFSRDELDLFATELNRESDEARESLDRIFYWTSGQPYLSQKLARAVSREQTGESPATLVDRLAEQQLAGRAALHSEPHMSHIHRVVIAATKIREPMLNLYGKIRKGITVPADLGSAMQRRLMSIGLLVIDSDSNLKIRNRLYEAVFTARWANENLPIRLKGPAIVAVSLMMLALIPFWYTQWLPRPYVNVLVSDEVDLQLATQAYENFRSFPGHSEDAEEIYRGFLQRRAEISTDVQQIERLATLASQLPDAGRIGDEFVAEFWDRKTTTAIREQDRDAAIIAKLESLSMSTSLRRQQAATLIADDYPFLLHTLPPAASSQAAFDATGMTLTTVAGAQVRQFSQTPQGMQERAPWSVTALEVTPLLRRVIVDRSGVVDRVGLTLNVSHAQLSDLRIKIIAPSGRAVELVPELERASTNDDIRIPARQLQELRGESLNGTWSLSLRDESLGVAGQLVGWNLNLNSQSAVEQFQRGLNIPDPVERETSDIWFDRSGRHAIARAQQSDSVRIWDLAYAEPVRAIALPESEILIGLDFGARHLVSATQETINIWDTATGDKLDSLAIGAPGGNAQLTPDGQHIVVERRSDTDTQLELWALESGAKIAEVTVAGSPALLSIDASAQRVAVADFDRAVRVWDFRSGELLGQFDLPEQPSEIDLSNDGQALSVVYRGVGLSVWHVDNNRTPLLALAGKGAWQARFSPSGNLFAAGRPSTGFQIHSSLDGSTVGPRLGLRAGLRNETEGPDLLQFSQDERLLLTGRVDGAPRFWRVPIGAPGRVRSGVSGAHTVWSAAADRPIAVSATGEKIAIGDHDGHVHILPLATSAEEIAAMNEDVSFLGHRHAVEKLRFDEGGSFVASAATDNTVRVWHAKSGEPLPYTLEIEGSPVSRIAFSSDAELIGVLNGGRVSIIRRADGELLTSLDSGFAFSDLAFGLDKKLYLGGDNGSLTVLAAGADGNWQSQQVWQGEQGIRLLRASPRGDYLIVVDNLDNVNQLILAEGHIASAKVQLPSAVRQISFAQNSTRLYAVTDRWVHRINASKNGLTWADALLVPATLGGAELVHRRNTDTSARSVHTIISNNGVPELRELDFRGTSGTGLFGSRDELLQEWRGRLIADSHEAF